ncbi:AAA family ATPase [Pectobacterium versatile]|uniref:AAA family ATPase n=1 Tax=Pectobacterium versatile TaxID=2488639 RepID=UPI0019691905|nr:AAA family ATPase [Pectobacterium versatile]MBN3238336.1 ATP-binding protein [Pectobacterium versatile]
MYKIKHVKISGIWGWKTIETDFYDDVSIFIGTNGTGKTTFINILISVLRVDVSSLDELWFDSAQITFEKIIGSSIRKRTLIITRDSDEYGEVIKYKLSRLVYRIPSMDGRTLRSAYVQRRIAPIAEEVRSQIQNLIKFSSLSVSRAGISDIDESDFHSNLRDSNVLSPVDKTLKGLMERLKTYQLNKAETSKDIAREFQEEVFISVLYNKDIDSSVGLDKISNKDLQNEMAMLQKTYYEMGIQNIARKGKAKELIKKHFDAIQESIKYLQETMAEKKVAFEVNKIFAFPLLKRTRLIIEAGRLADNRRKELFAPLTHYRTQLQSFFKDKTPNLKSDGALTFVDNKRGGEYDYLKLSSGEKQVLILLTEALLQEGESKLYIADEPELSLHIDWQGKIIPSIRSINRNAQIIIATHSPEVAGEYPYNVLDMEDICSE